MFEKPFEKPHRVAVFQSMTSGYTIVLRLTHGDDSYSLSGYARISEWQDVDFLPLTHEEVAITAIAGLTKIREEVVNEFSNKLAEIDGRIANFRCLPAPSDV